MVTSPTRLARENCLDAIGSPSASATYSPHRVWNPIRLTIAFLTRIGWHIRAYGTILGILFLTLISLIVLQTYEFCRSALRRSVGTKAIELSNHDSVQ